MSIRSLGLAPLLGLAALSSTAHAADTDLRLCSIGYVPSQAKRATVLGATSGSFVVRRAADGSEAFTGELETLGADAIADFSALTEEGSFVLEVADVGRSAAFPIRTDAYVEPFRTVMLGFYAWRSGVDVSVDYGGQTWFHTAGHLEDAYLDLLGEPGVIADGTGGWYDAGDYGKYVVNSGITLGLLLQAWEDFRPHLETLALEIPETGGSLPDYLDELRFQLDWMLKMQMDDGSVSHKITPIDFPGFIQPVEDTEPRYFSPWGSAATADFAATLAKAARAYREFDTDWADALEAAARKSYAFLSANPADHRADLSDFAQAQYQTSDRDDRVWAAAEIWETTGETSALADFETRVVALEDLVSADWDWNNPSNLGVFTYLRSARPGRNESLVERLEAALLSVADGHLSSANSSTYGRALPAVYWGSNGTVARICATLRLAHELADNEAHRGSCADQIAHLFGRNEYGRSQVTGVGIDPPRHPHDRRSGSDGIDPPYPGYLVGGASKPGNWLDDQESYETNEIAINWQGALVYALAGFVTAPAAPVDGTGAAGTPSSGSGGSAMTPNATGGSATSTVDGGASSAPTRHETSDDASCGCRVGRRSSGAFWVVAGLAVLRALLRRRRAQC
ncbi:MAG: glycoside hydrolase family 9 protein [Polyangiaceae bacterium]|nr:glycoside hydrolase family 9 protein [Polyangiaceae bacterium]